MPNIIKHKRNSVAGTIPGTGSLDQGELGINIADGKLYTKNSSNAVINLGVTSISGTYITPSSGNFTNSLQVNGTGVVSSSGGNSGYLSKFAGSNTINNSLVYDDGTNIGIGTTSPTSRLHVAGDVLATGSFIAGSGSAGNPSFEFVGDADTGMFTPSGNIISFATSGVERLRIDNIGNVGIGTTSPTAQLHVVGTGNFTNNLNIGGNLTITAGGTSSSNQIFLNGTTSNSIAFNNIGVSEPSNAIKVTGKKIILYPSRSIGVSEDFSLGIAGDGFGGGGVATRFVQTIDSTSSRFQWYADSTNMATLTGSGVLTIAGATSQINVDNLRFDNNMISATNANGNLIIKPNASGALQADDAGNSRGIFSVDLQRSRVSVSGVAHGNYSVIGGGRNNRSAGNDSAIGGGKANSAGGAYSVVGGGLTNSATGSLSTVSGGGNNTASGGYSTIGGGTSNTADGGSYGFSTVGGGQTNSAGGAYSTVGGGQGNTAGAYKSTVSGGGGNNATGENSTIGGGTSNVASGYQSIIGGGYGHTSSGYTSTIGGGKSNTASNYDTTVGGGRYNTAGGNKSTVGGGYSNYATGVSSTIGGGSNNSAAGYYGFATVGGGTTNSADGSYSTVGGGSSNSAAYSYCTIGGGNTNSTYGDRSTIGGGQSNSASAYNSTIGGGSNNSAGGGSSTVGGGQSNSTGGSSSTVGGGTRNAADAEYSTVPGGKEAKATRYGETSHSAGQFSNKGDAQHTILIARNVTSNATATILFLDGSSSRLTIPAETTWIFTIKLSAYNDTDNLTAGYNIRGCIRRNAANNTSIIGSSIIESWSEGTMSGCVATATADDTNEALQINVTGLASKNIRWVAVVDISQVSYATP